MAIKHWKCSACGSAGNLGATCGTCGYAWSAVRFEVGQAWVGSVDPASGTITFETTPPSVPEAKEAPSGGEEERRASLESRGTSVLVTYIFEVEKKLETLRTELSQATDKLNALAGELEEAKREKELAQDQSILDDKKRYEAEKERDELKKQVEILTAQGDMRVKELSAAREELKAAKEEAARYREALEWVSEQPNTIGKESLNADAGWKACWQVASAALSPVAEEEGGENGEV